MGSLEAIFEDLLSMLGVKFVATRCLFATGTSLTVDATLPVDSLAVAVLALFATGTSFKVDTAGSLARFVIGALADGAVIDLDTGLPDAIDAGFVDAFNGAIVDFVEVDDAVSFKDPVSSMTAGFKAVPSLIDVAEREVNANARADLAGAEASLRDVADAARLTALNLALFWALFCASSARLRLR